MLIVGLVIVMQTVTLAAVLVSTRRTVEVRSEEQLRAGAGLAEQLVRFRSGQLANAVAVLAADFGFREAVASGHGPTILSAAGNSAQRIGADLVLVLDTHGRTLAAAGVEKASVRPGMLEALVNDAGAGRDPVRFQVFGSRAYQVFLAPVRTPETIAWVLMGFVADEALAMRIRDLVGAEVRIVAHDASGAVRSASTPGAAGADAKGFLVFGRRLDARGDPVEVVLLKPLAAVFAPYQELREQMLLIDGVALLLAALLGALLGRSASRPIGELVGAARRIAQGEYGTSVHVEGGDEFQALARTFNAMQGKIAAREADITHQAEHDPLTQLPNRRVVHRTLASFNSESREAGEPGGAIILLELRNLREINASFGPLVGEQLLLEVAHRLQVNAAPGDLCGCVAEAQFIVLAHRCAEERALLYAEQLARVARDAFHIRGVSLELRVACGISLVPAHGRDPDELLQRAQAALEEADEVRSPVVLYHLGQEGEHRRRLTLVTDLRAAIEGDALTLFYQPKVDMTTRSVRSLEALVRWTHPQLGPVSPGEFVPLAERTGGCRALSSWVLRTAIRQLAAWNRAGLQLDVAVNLSAPDLLDPDLSDTILALLREERAEATALILEITESAVMREPRVAARTMQLLRIAGVRFSIDDFGTGHSSLSLLSSLPLDELKIDRSFIAPDDPGQVTILTSTIELGHSLGLKVVAEGVEDAAAWNLLRRLGCDYAQGFLVSKPRPAVEIPAFVRNANAVLPASDSTVTQIKALSELGTRSA